MKMEPRIGLLGICEKPEVVAECSAGERRRGAVARQPIARPQLEIASSYRLPRIASERQKEMYIVQGEEAEPEDLVGDEEVPEIGSAESRAGSTVAVAVEGPRIGAELSALDVEPAVAGEDRAIPAHTGGSDAIDQVDAAPNRLDEVFGEAHPHQVAGVRFRERLVHDLEHLVHRVLFLADGQTSDSEPGPVVHLANRRRGFAAEVRVDASLHDGKKRLSAFETLYLGQAPSEPADAALAGYTRRCFVAQARRNRIALHNDVGAEVALDLHHDLGGEEPARAIDVRLELDAVFVDRPELRQREYLESAGVREDRSIPVHELVEPAHLAHDFVAGPEMEVVGVSEDHRRAHLDEVVGVERLHRRERADGHEGRGLNGPVGGDKNAGARGAGVRDNVECESMGALGHRLEMYGDARPSRRAISLRSLSAF